jgi:hypothetical protein
MIIFTSHALLKLNQRGIAKMAVIKTIKLPDYKFLSHSKRIVAYKKFDKLYLKVIYKIENSNIIIITQYWEEKPKLFK